MSQRSLGAGIAVACGIAALSTPFLPAWANHHDPAALAPATALRLAVPAAAMPALAEVPASAAEHRAAEEAPASRPRGSGQDKAEALARALYLLGTRGTSRPFPGMPAD